MKLDDTEINRKKQKESLRNSFKKKQSETVRTSKKQ